MTSPFTASELGWIGGIVLLSCIAVYLVVSPKSHKETIIKTAQKSTYILQVVTAIVLFVQTGGAVFGLAELLLRLPIIGFALIGEWITFSYFPIWDHRFWFIIVILLDLIGFYNVLHAPFQALSNALGNTVLVQLGQFRQSTQQTEALQQIAAQTKPLNRVNTDSQEALESLAQSSLQTNALLLRLVELLTPPPKPDPEPEPETLEIVEEEQPD
jgi:hypothetical protein